MPCMHGEYAPAVQPDQVVLSTISFFKINVSLPLVTGKLPQNTVDVTSET